MARYAEAKRLRRLGAKLAATALLVAEDTILEQVRPLPARTVRGLSVALVRVMIPSSPSPQLLALACYEIEHPHVDEEAPKPKVSTRVSLLDRAGGRNPRRSQAGAPQRGGPQPRRRGRRARSRFVRDPHLARRSEPR